jgi:hypothetical protein
MLTLTNIDIMDSIFQLVLIIFGLKKKKFIMSYSCIFSSQTINNLIGDKTISYGLPKKTSPFLVVVSSYIYIYIYILLVCTHDLRTL